MGIDVFKVSLAVDGMELERVALSNTHVRWRWPVGFHAGTVELTLGGLTASPLVVEVLTDPSVAKLTRAQFAQMVGDILSDTLSLAALTGHRVGIARGDRPLEFARFEFLRQCFNRIEAAVEDINRKPWLRLERETRSVPLGRAGGVTPYALTRASRSMRRLTDAELERLPPAAHQLAVRLNQHLPTMVKKTSGRFDARRREHADILMVLGMWTKFLQHVARQLDSAMRDAADAGRIALIARHARQMGRRVERMTRLPLFEGVAPSHGTVAPSHLFRRVPAYRRFYRAYRDFLAGLSDVTGSFAKVPLRRTFDLYELWCFLRLARAAALHAGSEASWREAIVERTEHGGLVLQLEGKPLRFGAFTLIFQPLYREMWRRAGPSVGSFSRPMRPDIAIETSPISQGSARPIVVLDAKYRVEGGLSDAVSSIHTYRDSLVEQLEAGRPQHHQRTVQAAFLLTPQLRAEAEGDWQDDEAPEVFFREGYREAFRFGAVSMRPGMSVEQCREFLERLLSTCQT
ncbi:DUF2357 domain-containing protein [Corallococcus sp. AB045]|uniref:DUF2357 domain-containing protein n=1 Tax=Corallococcus sp. AB045 TaxID=2316719 RepID=UPI001315907D|nr:DUF2357 domain-containing protein [Corallococcus sp. AB045]